MDFPDELDTSFFARVRGRVLVLAPQAGPGSRSGRTVEQRAALLSARAGISNVMLASFDGTLFLCPGRSPSRGALYLPR